MWCKRHASTDATRAEPWKDKIQSHEQLNACNVPSEVVGWDGLVW